MRHEEIIFQSSQEHKTTISNDLTVLCWNFHTDFRFVMIAKLWKVGRRDALNESNRGNTASNIILNVFAMLNYK